MLAYVVAGKLIPHSNLVNNPFPKLETFFHDGTTRSKLKLKQLAQKKKKRHDDVGTVIEPPTYKVTFVTPPTPTSVLPKSPVYVWDILGVFDLMVREVYSSLDFYIQSTKVENTPKVKIDGRFLSVYLLLVDQLFSYLEMFEAKTNVPVAVLDKLIRYTAYLSPESNAWDLLAEEAGFDKVVYEPDYDVVQITCAGSLYPIKRLLLKEFSEKVAPFVTKLLYRSTRVFIGESEVSLCMLQMVKRQLDQCAKIEMLNKDFVPDEAYLRAIHSEVGLTALVKQGTSIHHI